MRILGNQPRKSNSRRIVKSSFGKPLLIKSQRALDYEFFVSQQITGKHRLKIEGFVDLKAVVYYKTKMSDLSLELIMDILEKKEIYLNDRQVMRFEAIKGKDKDEPRIDILISEVTEEEVDGAREKLLNEIKNKQYL